MQATGVGSRLDTRRRWKVLATAGAFALLLHAGALSGLDWAWPQRETPPLPAASMQVRALAPALGLAAPDGEVAATVPAPVQAPVVRMPTPPRPVARAVAPKAPEPLVRVVAAASVNAPETPELHVAALVATAAPSEAAPPPRSPSEAPAVSPEEAIPHYRTHMPPPMMLRYQMSRGQLHGNGEMAWRPGADRYELKLEGRLAGLTLLTQVSQGGFDAEGIAPLRFTDRRIRRPLTAANFQREAGKITFSGPQTEYPLHAGAQDRLSWMIQLAAILEAEPALGAAGAKVVMFVTGSHGDAGVWAFRSLGIDASETGGGAAAPIKFRREPRGPYDTTVEVWLDPKRHHLPVRASLRAGPNDDGLELRLQDMTAAS